MSHRKLPPIPIRNIPCNTFPFAEIPELGIEALPGETLQHLLDLDGDALEAAVEIAIRILDARQGDVDLEEGHDAEDIDEREDDPSDREPDDEAEDDDPDRCDAHDDIGTTGQSAATPSGSFTGAQQRLGTLSDARPGDCDDAEEDDTPEDDDPGEHADATPGFGAGATHEYVIASMTPLLQRGSK